MIKYEAPEIKINSQSIDGFIQTLIHTLNQHETNTLLFLRNIVVEVFSAIEDELTKRQN